MIKLQSITKVFPGGNDRPIIALLNIEIEINQGEFVVVVGPSGSGKSTLLFTIGAMQHPTKGNVFINNTDVYGLSPAERASLRRNQIGFVFQTFNLIPYLSCVENVVFPAVLTGESYNTGLKRAKMMLDRLGLSERLNHRPSQLSVGERQRVAICRSLINKPKVILADEPTGNMDSVMTDEVIKVFCDLNSDGQTIIMVTHDTRLNEKGTRLILLDKGVISHDRPSYSKEIQK